MKKIREDIKNRTFERVYLLCGNEEFLKRSCRNQLKAAVAGEDTMNLMTVTGKDIDPARLRDFTDTMPFFAEKRLLICEDTGLFKSASEGFDTWIDSLPESACVIFVESETDKRNRLYKKVSGAGYIAELNHPDEKALNNWILAQVKARNMKITSGALEQFLLCVGEEMDDVRNELEKLMSSCEETGEITAKSVEAVCSVKLKNRIFDLVTKAAQKQEKEAMALYYDLLALREAPLRILFLLTRQLNQYCTALLLLREHKSTQEITAALGVKPFIGNRIISQAKQFSLKELKELLDLSLDLEKRVKTGDMQDQIACELLLLSMMQRTRA